jgi:AcrR family transcriptional regulator
MADGDRMVGGDAASGREGVRSRPFARSARREATRQRVLDAAREVFAERGVIGGTVEDICERAGFTRGAFYSNFADKDDVLRALSEREHERLLAYVDAGLAQLEESLDAAAATGMRVDDGDRAEPLGAIVDRFLRSVPGDRQFLLMQSELEIHAIRAPGTARAVMAADAAFRARIAEFLVRGFRLLDREPVVDVGDLTDAVIAIVDRSTRRALLAGGTDPDALARLVLPLLIAAASRPRT